jgi:hypothetical protein
MLQVSSSGSHGHKGPVVSQTPLDIPRPLLDHPDMASFPEQTETTLTPGSLDMSLTSSTPDHKDDPPPDPEPEPQPSFAKPITFARIVTTHNPDLKPTSSPEPSSAPCTELLRKTDPAEGYHPMSGDAQWQQITSNIHFSTIYSTSTAIPEMSGDIDVATHSLLRSGTLSLVNTGAEGAGSVCRAVEFGPAQVATSAAEAVPYMHRTQSLDYAIVVKGESTSCSFPSLCTSRAPTSRSSTRSIAACGRVLSC